MKNSIAKEIVSGINTGKGGAFVYELTAGRIAKHVVRAELQNGSAWVQYLNEARFYTGQMNARMPFLPEILRCEWTVDELLIVMRKYRPLDKAALTGDMLDRVMAVLAQIHALPLPESEISGTEEPQSLSEAEIAQCLEGWRTVLAEHGDAFSQEKLNEAAERINALGEYWRSVRRCCCHGDFHAENLLTDDVGNIIVCDWQNVSIGHPAADIAFLLSRLAADGVDVDRTRGIRLYCGHAQGDITAEEIDAQMRLANLRTSFMFWHYYLHGAAEASVRDIYTKMIEDMDHLVIGMGQKR